MATLVLSTIGTAVGGPLAGAIGALVGGVIDQEVLFKPKGREGPRLKELDVQTSRYGAAIPQLFGTMRVAGQVVWATDLKETRVREGGAKGQPSVTAYHYSASFAVLLSARALRGVRRIWADGNLLRGEAGDWKAVVGGFRLHRGDEQQAADPLIAAIEGADAPALRGQAYVVFEDLALETFGNRIPSLTFEVEADAGAVTLGTIVTAASRGRLASAIPATVDGYAAAGDSIRAAVAPLAALAPIAWTARADGVAAVSPAGLATDRLTPAGSEGDGERAARIEHRRAAIESVPARVQLVHYDPARDFQTGAQTARTGGPGRIETRIDLPAALAAEAARGAAEALLARELAGREERTVRTPWRPDHPRPGDVVAVADVAGCWRVRNVAIERMVAVLTLARLPDTPVAAALLASGGRAAREPDLPAGPTRLVVAEGPPGPGDVPQLLLVAGGGAGWRGAHLALGDATGDDWRPVASAPRGAVTGVVAEAPLAEVPWGLIDRRSRLVVVLDDAAAPLANADAAAIDAGANCALVGDELVQFERAEPLAAGRWALTGLHRGRRATEAAMASGVAGAGFALIAGQVPVASGAVPGVMCRVLAQGVGDAGGVEAEVRVGGRSVVPPAPVHLRAVRVDGGLAVSWTRRTRATAGWRDHRDVPLGEESELYRIGFLGDGGVRIDCEVREPFCLIPGATGAGRIEVRQLGDNGVSAVAACRVEHEGDGA